MTNNDQDAKIKLVANIRLDRARLYSFENKTRNSKDQKRRKKNPRYAQPATPNHKAEKHPCEHLWKAFNTLKYTPLQLIFNSILTIGNTKQISAPYFLRLGASSACSKMSEIYQTVVMAAIYLAARDASRINKLIEKLARIRGRLSR